VVVAGVVVVPMGLLGRVGIVSPAPPSPVVRVEGKACTEGIDTIKSEMVAIPALRLRLLLVLQNGIVRKLLRGVVEATLW
jgi:hypothetical protein